MSSRSRSRSSKKGSSKKVSTKGYLFANPSENEYMNFYNTLTLTQLRRELEKLDHSNPDNTIKIDVINRIVQRKTRKQNNPFKRTMHFFKTGNTGYGGKSRKTKNRRKTRKH